MAAFISTPSALITSPLKISSFRSSCSKIAPSRFNTAPTHHARRSFFPSPKMAIVTENQGQPETLEFRIFYKEGASKVSPWHDVPLYANAEKTILNYINEIPKGTSAKMEIATDEELTPIKQDIKKGALRYYKYSPSLINYGALPQTWEDPNDIHPDTKCGGDNDPVDCIEISRTTQPMGAVYSVKPIGILALLDEGETDWKVIAISTQDPNADKINSVEDAEKIYPGLIHDVTEWFRLYKTAEGKGENTYAFGGKALGVDATMKVIAETHESWKKLRKGEIPNDDGLWL